MYLRSELALLASLASVSVLSADTKGADASRPRGVSPEFAKFYKSSTTPATFTCISHPSITIPFSRVNDDFCDCPDGSDEPGTSACSYLSHLSPPQPPPGIGQEHFIGANPNASIALPGFYCKNKGHIPAYLKFESVNDGVCDYTVCCDGSDEYASVGGVKCPDKCGEIGKEHKKHEEIRNKSLRNALKKKKDLLAQAQKLTTEVQRKIQDLEVLIKGHEKRVEQSRQNLKEVERKERMRVVKSDAAGKGKGKTGVLLGLAKGRVEELRKQLEKTKNHRDSMIERVTELEGILTTMKEERNPNFNDEGVKRAVRSWEDYAARETNDHWSEAEYRDVEAVLKEDGEESGINWTEFEGNDSLIDEDTAALYQLMNYLPVGLQLWVTDRVASLRQLLVENGVLSAPGTDAEVSESKAVQQAKKTLEEAERDVTNSQNEFNDAKADLEKNYGPNSIFRALKDTCVEKDTGEYIYEVCFLKSTTQKPKRGGAHTGMGTFTGFDMEIVDEELPLDGKGLGRGERVVMKYENGQHCWNGPNRSTKVVLACSEHDEIWKVSESEKCVYRMEVGTAAVCGYKNGDKQAGDPGANGKGEKKDEL